MRRLRANKKRSIQPKSKTASSEEVNKQTNNVNMLELKHLGFGKWNILNTKGKIISTFQGKKVDALKFIETLKNVEC